MFKLVMFILGLLQKFENCYLRESFRIIGCLDLEERASSLSNLRFYDSKIWPGTSLVVQWLRLCSSTTGGRGSTPGRGTKIPHAAPHGQEKKSATQKNQLGNLKNFNFPGLMVALALLSSMNCSQLLACHALCHFIFPLSMVMP